MNTTQCPRLGLELGPLDPESSALTLRPSCYRNRDKLRPGEPLGSYADFIFFDWWETNASAVLHGYPAPLPTLQSRLTLMRSWILYGKSFLKKSVNVL